MAISELRALLPGDVVIARVPDAESMRNFDRVREELRRVLPGGVEGLVVPDVVRVAQLRGHPVRAQLLSACEKVSGCNGEAPRGASRSAAMLAVVRRLYLLLWPDAIGRARAHVGPRINAESDVGYEASVEGGGTGYATIGDTPVEAAANLAFMLEHQLAELRPLGANDVQAMPVRQRERVVPGSPRPFPLANRIVEYDEARDAFLVVCGCSSPPSYTPLDEHRRCRAVGWVSRQVMDRVARYLTDHPERHLQTPALRATLDGHGAREVLRFQGVVPIELTLGQYVCPSCGAPGDGLEPGCGACHPNLQRLPASQGQERAAAGAAAPAVSAPEDVTMPQCAVCGGRVALAFYEHDVIHYENVLRFFCHGEGEEWRISDVALRVALMREERPRNTYLATIGIDTLFGPPRTQPLPAGVRVRVLTPALPEPAYASRHDHCSGRRRQWLEAGDRCLACGVRLQSALCQHCGFAVRARTTRPPSLAALADEALNQAQAWADARRVDRLREDDGTSAG